MEKKKIFIEIQVPPSVQKRLSQKIEPFRDLPIKWMKEKNIHLTVAFVGWIDESVVPDICLNVANAVSNMESFDLELDVIEFGPDINNPKMLWAAGQPNQQLKELNEAVEKALGIFRQSHKIFRPHITLGRIRKSKWEQLKEKPQINEKINLIIPVENISVMESRGGGDEYISLEECPLA